MGIEGIPAKWSSLMRGRAIADHLVTRLVKGAWSRCPDLSRLAKPGWRWSRRRRAKWWRLPVDTGVEPKQTLLRPCQSTFPQ